MQQPYRPMETGVKRKVQTWHLNILFFYTVNQSTASQRLPQKQEPLPTVTVGGVRWLTPPFGAPEGEGPLLLGAVTAPRG